MMNAFRLEWHENAKCANPANGLPTDWDSKEEDRRKAWKKLVESVELCSGCVVAGECASDALDDPMTMGVTRAGIPILSLKSSVGKSRALRAIASGTPMATAALEHVVAGTKQYARARPRLEELEEWDSHRATTPASTR